LRWHEKRRTQMASLQEAQSRRNALSERYGQAMAKKDLDLAEKLKFDVSSPPKTRLLRVRASRKEP